MDACSNATPPVLHRSLPKPGQERDARTRAVEIRAGWRGLEAVIAANRFPLGEATALAASLQISHLW